MKRRKFATAEEAAIARAKQSRLLADPAFRKSLDEFFAPAKPMDGQYDDACTVGQVLHAPEPRAKNEENKGKENDCVSASTHDHSTDAATD